MNSLATTFGGGFIFLNTVMFGGVGAGIGVGVAASMTDERLIYARPGLPVKVAVAPVIDGERQAIRVSLRF